MTYPGEGITADHRSEQPPQIAGEHQKENADQRQGRACKMQLAVERLTVFGLLGAVLIFGSALVSELGGKKRRQNRQQKLYIQ